MVGCGLPRTIDDADEVKISYTLAFPDGEILDSGTANIIVGQPRDEIEAFQTLIVGARVDDVLSGTITPEE
ncbi:MAG: hypothetical protein LBH96_04630 [Candidatus Peribacteria bacterium]|nr:hypothetical protein [Candidatus Peribacteria bacterium]